MSEKETPDTGRLEWKHDDKREVLFVEKQVIVSDPDVQSVMRCVQQDHALSFVIKPEGAKRLAAATTDGHGRMRIAILIHGEVVSAPVVNSQLGKNFIVEGLKEFPDEDLDLMVWQIQGKSDDEIAKLLREQKQQLKAPPPPRLEPVYYTDKEYEALKREREKIGMHYLDQLPAKEELDQRLKTGMSATDVTAVMGPATFTHCDDAKQVTSLSYDLAPERRSMSLEMRPSGWTVHFSDGKVRSWGLQYSNAPRQEKPPTGGPRALDSKTPVANFAEKNFDMLRWIEGIELSLKKGHDKPLPQDYMDLISIIHMTAAAAKESTLIEANCAVIKILGQGFPEVEALRKTAKDDKIPLSKLPDLLDPYLLGQKPFPANLVPPKPGDN